MGRMTVIACRAWDEKTCMWEHNGAVTAPAVRIEAPMPSQPASRPTLRPHPGLWGTPQMRMLSAWALVCCLSYAFLPQSWLGTVRWVLFVALAAIIGRIVALRLRRH